MENKYEERIVVDCNGFYFMQSRILPVLEWDSCDGWRSCFVSSDPTWIREHMREEFRTLPVVTL